MATSKAAMALAASIGAITPAAAAAPVRVQPILIVPSEDPAALAGLTIAVRRLVERGYVTADARNLKTIRLSRRCISDAGCLAPGAQLRRHGANVAVIASGLDRQGQQPVRCVGPDPLRHHTARMNLRDASSPKRAVADEQLAKLAKCIVDSLQPPRRAE